MTCTEAQFSAVFFAWLLVGSLVFLAAVVISHQKLATKLENLRSAKASSARIVLRRRASFRIVPAERGQPHG